MSSSDFINPHRPEEITDYEWVFENASAGKLERTSVATIGYLEVPTGELVIGDPYAGLLTALPYLRRTPNGRFPVRVVRRWEGDFLRNRFMRVDFSDSAVSRWELAVTRDDLNDLNSLAGDEFLGVSVDSGNVFVCDKLAHERLSKFVSEEEAKSRAFALYDDVFLPMYESIPEDTHNTAEWLNYWVEEPSCNMLVVASGDGDGLYPSYWGYSASGGLVTLVTDFAVTQ